VVAIDPAATSEEDSDETGIVVAGEIPSDPPHYDVLEDASDIYTPDEWAKTAVRLYYQWEADRIVGEANNGGDMIEAVLRHVDPNLSYKKVTATRGKAVRAEPISALYEQHRVHHVGVLGSLEDQMVTWNPKTDDKSPDRVDALVWALTELSGVTPDGFGAYYSEKSEQAVKHEKSQEESKLPIPKMQPRKWSLEILAMQMETKVDVTADRWAVLRDEADAWIAFCAANGGGDRLAFAQRELARLDKKFATATIESK
jgi:hypothetical protein